MAEDRDDTAILKEIRDRFKWARTEWKDITDEGDVNMRYVAGDPWEPNERADRDKNNRPCLSLDELGQYFNQAINQNRQNQRAMKFTPRGNGANDRTAQFYADKARDLEYESHAQLAYITAFENAVQRNVGWVRIVPKYTLENVTNPDPSAADQDLAIEPIFNPNMVIPDPSAKRPERSDMNFLFYVEDFDQQEFKNRWPNANIVNFSQDLILKSDAGEWFKNGKVQVGEYWVRKEVGSKSLYVLKPEKDGGSPEGMWESDFKKKGISSDRVHTTRKVRQHRVDQYITNGLEILEHNPWRGKYIPFVACTGKSIYVDEGSGPKLRILALTDLARNPQMLYAYYCTTEAEIVGAIPKIPYFAYEGQISDEQMTAIEKSLHAPVAVVMVKPTVPGAPPQAILPLPQRQPWDPPLQGIQMGKESARRAIQAALGIMPLPTAAQRKNDKSGVALEQIEKTEQIGSFHLTAHYDDMIRQVGIIFEDLCDKTYDTARDTAIRKADGSAQQVRINDPSGSQYQNGQLSGEPLFTKGDHQVTVSAGPAVDSQREGVNEFLDSLTENEQMMQLAPDLIVKARATSMSVALNPVIEELIERITPQQFRKPKDGQMPDPQQLMAQVQQSQQQIQQMQQAIAQLTMEIKTKQHEIQGQMQIEQMKQGMETDRQIKMKQMDIAGKIEVARITAAKQSADTAMEAQEERLSTGLEMSHEAVQNTLDRAHEMNLEHIKSQAKLQQQSQDHQQTMTEQEAAHQQTLVQNQQAHAHALAQGEQGITGTLANTNLSNQNQEDQPQ